MKPTGNFINQRINDEIFSLRLANTGFDVHATNLIFENYLSKRTQKDFLIGIQSDWITLK